jgi:hypothetical protein
MNNIFVKLTDKPRQKFKFDNENLKNSIPINALDKSDLNMSKTYIEWRWRIFNIKQKEYVEISYQIPNGKRIFINKYSEWTDKTPDNDFDNFVIKQYFSYTELD